MVDFESLVYKNISPGVIVLDFNTNLTVKSVDVPLIDITYTFMTVCSPAVICFNIFVLYLSYKYVNFNGNVEQIFVVNMTFADLMYGCMYMTCTKHLMNLPSWLCKWYYFALSAFNMASVSFLLQLNVYKFVILFFPVYSIGYKSKSKIKIQACLAWHTVAIAVVIFSLLPTFKHFDHDTYSCLALFDHKIYTVMVMCFYIVPLCVSLLLSICIFCFAQIWTVRRKRRKPVDSVGKWKETFGRVIFVFISTVWASVTFLPYRISYFRMSLCLDSDSYDRINETENRRINDTSCIRNLEINILLMVLAVGFVMTPLITIFTQRIYRKGAMEIFGKLKQCCENDSHH